VYVLSQAVKWAVERGLPICDALDLYDKVRSPHYKDMVGAVVRYRSVLRINISSMTFWTASANLML
jgi:hypothetical protein